MWNGADEVDDNRQLIKGGGGAHAREKVLACSAKKFVCIVDGEKRVDRLGKFSLPVRFCPWRAVLRRAVWRRRGAAPNGVNLLLPTTATGFWMWRFLDLTDAVKMETEINAIAGVLDNGLFARRKADVVFNCRQ